MGTNYYFLPDVNDEEYGMIKSIHIGKNSAGWIFSFHGYCDEFTIPDGVDMKPYNIQSEFGSSDGILYRMEPVHPVIRSKNEWIQFIERKNGSIVNEYGTVISIEKFKEMIAENSPDSMWRNNIPLRSQYIECDSMYTIEDEDGYPISFNEFF